jgi:hypothetical protein
VEGWPAYWIGAGRPACRFDVSPDQRFAVFAGTERIVVVDRDGVVRWQVSHPACPSTLDDLDELASCAVFSPEGEVLWAFVPRAAPTEDQRLSVERWRINVSDWRTTFRVATRYRCDTDVLVPW